MILLQRQQTSKSEWKQTGFGENRSRKLLPLSRLSCFTILFDRYQQTESKEATHVRSVIISYSTIVSRQKKTCTGARPSRGKNCCTKWTSNCENLQSCEAVKTRYAKSATKTHEAKILSNFNLLLLFLLFLLFAAKFFSYVLQTI